ncbi:MAG: hypothetical protein JWL84_6060 [Rhodospirillales bacterium]|nr:hypothetical protein [Rhodospirillales bacterium]
MKWSKQSLALLVSSSLVFATAPAVYADEADLSAAPLTGQVAPQPSAEAAQSEQQSPGKWDQVVAPVALYPDALVAQILAASAFPSQIVEADRWMRQHSRLKGEALAKAVDKQSWDPSVKALTQFPAVLANMDKNLSWTSALGDAYANGPQDVLDAIQTMRRRAQQAGHLQSTAQETVTTDAQTIAIAPANPQTVYLPQYDPWLVYGGPLVAYPGWVAYPGLFLDGPEIAFGLGIGVGLFAGFGWGWHAWGADWHHGGLTFNHGRYIAHGRTFGHVGGFHGGGFRGFAAHGHGSLHSGAFSGFAHGGMARADSSRGHSSFGGGAHAFAGGFHGGGFHGGGGHR